MEPENFNGLSQHAREKLFSVSLLSVFSKVVPLTKMLEQNLQEEIAKPVALEMGDQLIGQLRDKQLDISYYTY